MTVEGPASLNDLLWVANTRHGPGGHWHARPRPGDPAHDHLGEAAGARAYLRVEANDRAGNVGRYESREPVLLEPPRPKARVLGVSGGAKTGN